MIYLLYVAADCRCCLDGLPHGPQSKYLYILYKSVVLPALANPTISMLQFFSDLKSFPQMEDKIDPITFIDLKKIIIFGLINSKSTILYLYLESTQVIFITIKYLSNLQSINLSFYVLTVQCCISFVYLFYSCLLLFKNLIFIQICDLFQYILTMIIFLFIFHFSSILLYLLNTDLLFLDLLLIASLIYLFFQEQ